MACKGFSAGLPADLKPRLGLPLPLKDRLGKEARRNLTAHPGVWASQTQEVHTGEDFKPFGTVTDVSRTSLEPGQERQWEWNCRPWLISLLIPLCLGAVVNLTLPSQLPRVDLFQNRRLHSCSKQWTWEGRQWTGSLKPWAWQTLESALDHTGRGLPTRTEEKCFPWQTTTNWFDDFGSFLSFFHSFFVHQSKMSLVVRIGPPNFSFYPWFIIIIIIIIIILEFV